MRSNRDFLEGLRALDGDTLYAVAGVLVRRERQASMAGNQLEAACHSLGALMAQRVITERNLGVHPEVKTMLEQQDQPVTAQQGQ